MVTTRWALWIVLVGALLYVPNFWVGELEKEEGRRALPAREMIESGDWVLPTIWQRPYLAKPPLFPWLVALASTVTGGVGGPATRLPSVVATILTALGLYLFGRGCGRPRAGGLAGLVFLVSFAAFEKGAFGELEAAFGLFVFAALALLAVAVRRGGAWIVAAGLGLAGALLIKGPAALPFLVAGLAGIAWQQRRVAILRSPRVLVPIGIGFLVLFAWIGLLLLDVDREVLVAKWVGEVTRTGQPTVWAQLLDRLTVTGGVLSGFMPGLLVCALMWRAGPRWLDDPLVRFASGALVLSGLFFIVFYPGTRIRYLYPALPWCCLLAGVGLDAAWQPDGERLRARLRRAAWGAFGLFGAAVLAGAVACVVPIRGMRIDWIGVLVLVAAGALVVLGVRELRRRPQRQVFLVAVLGCLVCARLLQVSQVVPHRADRHRRIETAAELDRALPAGAGPVRLHFPAEYNTLFYVSRELRWIEDLEAAEAGELLIVDENAAGAELVTGWDVLARVPLEGRTALVARVR